MAECSNHGKEDGMSADDIAVGVVVIFFGALFTTLIVSAVNESEECARKGGVTIRGTCISRDVVIK